MNKEEELNKVKVTLSELEERIQSLVTNLPMGLIIVSQDQKVEALNQRARDIFDYSSEEIAGQSISSLFPEIESISQSSKPIELVANRSSGEKFVAELQTTELMMHGQDRLFINIQDIDERYKLESLRKSLIEMISHDLRAPLMAIQLTLEMLEEGGFGDQTDEGKQAINNAIASTNYLTSLVRNLLDSEKVDRNEFELDYEETSVKRIVDKAIATVQNVGHKSSVSIESDYTNDQCEADTDRIVQVLLNLITNAIKYSPNNSSVLVKAGMDGVNIKFEVIDQGPGIPLEKQGLIFQRYQQIHDESTEKRTGFGLGLAISKGLIEKHKGKIWVESKVGSGSCFGFTIPQERSH